MRAPLEIPGVPTQPSATIGRGGFWPDPDQENLLRAALLEGKEAREAWLSWRQATDIDHLDPGSHRLLGLLERNLRRLAVEDDLLPRLRGVYRQFWCRNQVLFHGMGRLLADFQSEGIPCLVLKGAPLTLLHYRDFGVRPMADFDLLVPPDSRNRALDCLRSTGWSPIYYGDFDALTPSYLSYATSHGFRNSGQREFDLHWHLFPFCSAPDCDRGFWERAVPFEMQGLSTQTLAPGDHLLHACVHGAAWNEIPPIRWVADALTLLGSDGKGIDWAALVVEAQHHRVVVPLRETLSYLRQRFQAPVPPEVLQELGDWRPGPWEALRFRGQSLPLDRRGPWLELQLLYAGYRDWRSRENLPPSPLTFLRTVQHTAKRRRLRDLIAYAPKKGLERLQARFRPDRSTDAVNQGGR